MAVTDFEVKAIFVNYIIPVIIMVVSIMCIIKGFRRYEMRFMSWSMNKFCKKIHQRVSKEKDSLFQPLLSHVNNIDNQKLHILEIGAGTGMNFKFYPDYSFITCIDPNKYTEQYMKANLQAQNPKVHLKEIICGFAENMSCFKDDEFDVVVETFVLCSVNDLQAVLNETIRILKPGGKFYFLDHVGAQPKTWLRWFQNRINYVWKTCTGNCHINREMEPIMHNTGFSEVELHQFNMKIRMPLVRPCIYGTCTK